MTCRKEFQIDCHQCNSSYLREEELGTSLNSRDRALAKTFLSDARKSQVNFSILGQCFGPIFGQIVSIRVKALSDTNLAKREKAYFRLVSLAAVFWMSCNAPPTLFLLAGGA